MSNLTTRVAALESSIGNIETMLAALLDAQAPARTTLANHRPEPTKVVTAADVRAERETVTLKPLSKGEIKRLRASGAEWVKGKADWQLQGRKPANAVATGRLVSAKVLASHGYSRPTGALKAALKAA